MKELDILGFDGVYTITTEGDVYSYKTKKTRKLKPQKASQSKKGYYQVRLFRGEGDYLGKLQYVHRLVWQTFKGDIPQGYEMDHIDGDTSNNSLDNLQIITRRRNIHKWADETYGPTLRTKRKEIIKDYIELGSYPKVAKKWGVSMQMIYRIIKDVYHQYNRKTKKTITKRYDPTFTDAFTENDFRNRTHLKKVRESFDGLV